MWALSQCGVLTCSSHVGIKSNMWRAQTDMRIGNKKEWCRGERREERKRGVEGAYSSRSDLEERKRGCRSWFRRLTYHRPTLSPMSFLRRTSCEERLAWPWKKEADGAAESLERIGLGHGTIGSGEKESKKAEGGKNTSNVKLDSRGGACFYRRKIIAGKCVRWDFAAKTWSPEKVSNRDFADSSRRKKYYIFHWNSPAERNSYEIYFAAA